MSDVEYTHQIPVDVTGPANGMVVRGCEAGLSLLYCIIWFGVQGRDGAGSEQ